ncbi:hypothetical protein TRFO_28203 [Tritrichomonas foetus]|uniref:Leucine Rich Repeat family protein n=1 Tax=Tritrichomonas foetus TaxID=1144522 RepID=A0A1J4K3J3_9EUKA|nr:hypothetical protein TRFO_28203 [Tritrichomonas foetus]|eukprot:OHT04316.1 hypothetical protein TRFO_28203 [Tritrichomonas foetus]
MSDDELRPQLPLATFFPDVKDALFTHEDRKRFPSKGISREEEKDIISKFPKYQNEHKDLIFCTRAALRFNRKAEFNGVVALSLHFIGFFHSDGGSHYVRDEIAHLFDICSIRVKTENKVLIFCRLPESGSSKNNYEIVNCRVISSEAIKLAQILYRNYMLSTVHDPYNTADFRTFDHSYFPKFDNGFSPSQGYQMTYFAFCSRLNVRYNHEVTRYYHEHIRLFDGIFDFSQLPMELIGPRASINDMLPAIYAMMYVPYVQGVICHNIQIPYISGAVSRIVYKSNYLRMVHLAGCGVDALGMDQIGRGLCNNIAEYNNKCESNEEKYKRYKEKFPIPIPVCYWNFENNVDITDADAFFRGMRGLKSNVFYLSFSNCRIEKMKVFFVSLYENVHLYGIKYLYFNGNTVTKEGMNYFVGLLNKIADHLEFNAATKKKNKKKEIRDEEGHLVNVCYYKRLGVAGDEESLQMLFKTLKERKYPIEELSLAGTLISRSRSDPIDRPSKGAKYVINYISQSPYLKVLDLSNARMDGEDIQHILRGFYSNPNLDRINVKLNGIGLRGNKLIQIAKGFLYTDLEKWETIELANNDMSEFELDFLIPIFSRMPNLTELNLSHNFASNDLAIDRILHKLSQLPNLRRIGLAGIIGRKSLHEKIYPLLDEFIKKGTLEEIDLSGNEMGDQGYEKIIEIMEKSPNLTSLLMDQNSPRNLRLIDTLIRTAMSKKNLTFFVFPQYDTMSYLLSLSKEYYKKNRFPMVNLRYMCNIEMNNHRIDAGLKPQLPFKATDDVGDLVNDINDTMHDLLDDRPETHIHGGIAKDINVPLPFIDETQRYGETEDNTWTVDIPELPDKYHAPHINLRINEEGYVQKANFDFPEPEKQPEPEQVYIDPDDKQLVQAQLYVESEDDEEKKNAEKTDEENQNKEIYTTIDQLANLSRNNSKKTIDSSTPQELATGSKKNSSKNSRISSPKSPSKSSKSSKHYQNDDDEYDKVNETEGSGETEDDSTSDVRNGATRTSKHSRKESPKSKPRKSLPPLPVNDLSSPQKGHRSSRRYNDDQDDEEINKQNGDQDDDLTRKSRRRSMGMSSSNSHRSRSPRGKHSDRVLNFNEDDDDRGEIRNSSKYHVRSRYDYNENDDEIEEDDDGLSNKSANSKRVRGRKSLPPSKARGSYIDHLEKGKKPKLGYKRHDSDENNNEEEEEEIVYKSKTTRRTSSPDDESRSNRKNSKSLKKKKSFYQEDDEDSEDSLSRYSKFNQTSTAAIIDSENENDDAFEKYKPKGKTVTKQPPNMNFNS